MRTIVANNKIYKYKIGQQNIVIKEDKKSTIVGFDELTGLSWYVIEHGNWKKNFHITPKIIANWIEKHLK
jgi:hypothetical protein